MIADITTVVVAWTLLLTAAWLGAPQSRPLPALLTVLTVATTVTAIVLSREQVYLARVLAIRAVEVQRLGRACLISAVPVGVVDRLIGAPLGWQLVAAATLATYTLLLVSRGVVQAWLYHARRRGHTGRSLLVVGDPAAGSRTLELLRERPGLGYRVMGYVSPQRSTTDLGVPWLGTPADLAVITQLTAATGVLIVAGALDPKAVPATISKLRVQDVHVHLVVEDSQHRPSIRVSPLLHKAPPPLRTPGLSNWQRIYKRGFDLVAGGLLTAATAPVMMLAAGLLKLTAGGPVLVRDMRMGPDGEQFMVTRLRTRHLPHRPLAQLVGRACRRLCIDELPQLGNVLAGSMSLVGPRPYRPSRAADVASAPSGMSAGLIGLRHVETRDFPEQGPHRRLDHFYAEHWSIGLDLSIVAASATDLLCRTARGAIRGGEHAVVGSN